jgi:hypothetical protein
VEITEKKEDVYYEVIELEEEIVSSNRPSGILSRFIGQPRALAEAGDLPADAKLVIWYTLDAGESPLWRKLDSFSASRMSNALKNGYFDYELEFINNWSDIENLSIRVEGIGNENRPFIAYLDSLWVEAVFEPAEGLVITKKDSRDMELEMLSGFDIFSADDDKGEFVFRYNKKEQNIIDSLTGFFGFGDYWKNVKIDAYLIDSNGKEVKAPMVMIMDENGEFTIEIH